MNGQSSRCALVKVTPPLKEPQTPTAPPSPDDPIEPLFERVSETDYRCTRCGATNTCEADSFPSFGGTTEWWERCTDCGAIVSGCNMSAVL